MSAKIIKIIGFNHSARDYFFQSNNDFAFLECYDMHSMKKGIIHENSCE